MAKKRSKKRRPTASGPLSEAPASSLSKTPPPVAADEQEVSSTKPQASGGLTKKRSFFDMPEDGDQPEAEEPTAAAREANESSSGQEQPSTDPSDDAKQKPAGLQEQDPGPEPGKDGGADPEPGASQEDVAKAKDEGEDEPEDRKGDADAEEEAAEHDRLHDDFFRKGEEVEKQHMALAQGEPPRLEDTGQTHLVSVRSAKDAAERRRKMRRVVGYVLAPAVLIAVIAGVKSYKNGGGAAAGSNRPVATVTVKPVLAPSMASAAVSVPTEVDAAQEAAEEMADAAVEAEASAVEADAAVAEPDAAAPEAEAGATAEAAVALPEGVDARKEALKALEQGKWARAAEMAQAAIAASPDDATLYLYQATALQEMGRRGDAKAVFQKCVEQAKRGPIHECRMFSK